MISAEPQQDPAQPDYKRLKVVFGVLIISALAVVLSATAFYSLGGYFTFYDDVGFLMLTQKTFFSGHALYDQTFTAYGPAYYAYEQLLHAITRLPLSHDSTLIITVFAWVGISLLCTGYVARLSRNVFLTAGTFFAVFVMLGFLKNEPGHPQELCALSLGGMLLGSTFLTRGRQVRIILGAIGFLAGLLSMTKPNLGVFAALAGWISLANLVADRRRRNVLFGASALAALLLPLALMRHNLSWAGPYCLLESAAILLLVVQLATSKVDRSLPLRTLAAPALGFVAALLACAAYALATGTSPAGLLHGLVLQHIGFDQVFYMVPRFGLDDVLLTVSIAGLVWVATGPGKGIWKDTPWVPALVKFSVAPFMVAIALVVGLSVSPIFVWCLPLLVATAQFAPSQPTSLGETAPRHFAIALAVLSGLWGYPIWGSQAGMSLFLLIPVAMVWCADAVCYGFGSVPTDSRLPSGGIISGIVQAIQRRRTAWTLVSYVAALGTLGLSLVRLEEAAKAYHDLPSSGLRGSRFLHMPAEMADFYRRVIQAAQAHGRSFFTMPGLGSLYFWANQDPPTCANPTTWMTLLTPDQQARVVADLQKTPNLCVIRWPLLVDFWTRGRDISQNKVVRYIEETFTTVETFNGLEIMVRRSATGQPEGK